MIMTLMPGSLSASSRSRSKFRMSGCDKAFRFDGRLRAKHLIDVGKVVAITNAVSSSACELVIAK